jgi:flagellar biosynthesis/type III secretory pathway protein FliH
VKQGIQRGVKQGLQRGVKQGEKQGMKKGQQLGYQQGAESLAKLLKEGFSLDEALEKVKSFSVNNLPS